MENGALRNGEAARGTNSVVALPYVRRCLDFYLTSHRGFRMRHHIFYSLQNLHKAQSARLEGMSRVQECAWGLRVNSSFIRVTEI